MTSVLSSAPLDSRLSISTTAAPAAGTKPPALALMGREAASGRSFQSLASTRIASSNAVVLNRVTATWQASRASSVRPSQL